MAQEITNGSFDERTCVERTKIDLSLASNEIIEASTIRALHTKKKIKKCPQTDVRRFCRI